ncbi:hypothetical protein K3495_g7115 [Podosphaera aphanis]|nr:hypothetical protein K3495_g7115 [Podosphaera aphanis]
MCHGFDLACVLKDTVESFIKYKVPIILYINSLSLFECLVKLGTIRGEDPMIDMTTLRQAYEREISEIVWIKGESNPADALTKYTGNQAVHRIVDSNKVNLEAGAWVES